MATIFLDLDGTLVDPGPGILGTFRLALEEMGHEAPPEAELRWVIGPALVDSFAHLGVTDPDEALARYRRHYTGGMMYEAAVYPGIPAALETLKAEGHTLHLATAKPHVYATKITAHFGLAPYLTHQFGPELDGTRNDKGELLAHALNTLGHGPETCLMVGDRMHDYRAARAVNMRALALRWGYGSAEEWGLADGICAAPEFLPEVIAMLLGQNPFEPA